MLAWAQADRFALSLNFLTNGFDLFNAETFLLNTEFPMNFKTQRESSIVAVNLPIHEFIIALIMELFSSKSPIIFRMYVFVWSCIGMFYLFKITDLFELRWSKQLILLIIALSSPVYIYYQDNFLPSATNLSTVIIGIYFYFKYLKNDHSKSLYIAVFFLLLSAIYRTTAIIPMIAILSVEFLRIIKRKAELIPFVTILVLSFIVLYFQRQHLLSQIHEYGSIFLYYLVPASDFESAQELILMGFKKWFFDCISPPHVFLILLTILIVVVTKKTLVPLKRIDRELLRFVAILVVGYLAFWIAMLTKIIDHDYYYLDTFYVPVILSFMIILKQTNDMKLHKPKTHKIFNSLAFLLALGSIFYGYKIQKSRTSWRPADRSIMFSHSLIEGDRVLNELGIKEDAIILVIGPKYPNLPFVHLKRKGLILFSKKKNELENGLEWDYDYIVSPNHYFDQFIAEPFPDIKKRISLVFKNERFSVFKPKDRKQKEEQ